jgi:3-oxoacyl-[acyl-carrier protein] reductase
VLAGLVEELGERAHALTADLADPESPDRLRDAEAVLGRVDILVNNAGITHDARRLRDEGTVIEVNFRRLK